MKIKRYLAADMRAALRAIREEQGADAVILSTRRTSEGVEVCSAIDLELAAGQGTLAEHAPRTQDPAVLQAQVRIALGRQIVQDIVGSGAELPVITLEPELEQLLQGSLQAQGGNAAIEPGLAERLQLRLAESAGKQESSGEAAVLMVAPQLRTTLARFTRATVPGLHVLAWNEIPDNRRVRLVAAVGR